jgi:UDP-2,3-diacylglucosamine hydrolase
VKKKGKIYFASDFHLGLKGKSKPRDRELHVVKWLDSIKADSSVIYLVGDVFDFWWEYKKVVPKGFTRFLGKVSELTDSGIEVHFFTGNHDMWIDDYLNAECGMILHTGPQDLEINGKLFHVAHGEGLGTDSRSYRILLWIFRNNFLRKLYSMLHPGFGIGLAHRWSLKSRLAKSYYKEYRGAENEELFRYASHILKERPVDYFVFGHRHILIDEAIGSGSRLFILGNWFNKPAYLEIDGENVELKDFPYH